MAAIRYTVRRLGGSLLQRTQAAGVVEERRRLVPSRIMRSRQLSSKPAGEIPKEQDPSDLQSQLEHERTRRRNLIKVYDYLQKEADTPLMRFLSAVRTADSVATGAAKWALFGFLTAVAFGGEG